LQRSVNAYTLLPTEHRNRSELSKVWWPSRGGINTLYCRHSTVFTSI